MTLPAEIPTEKAAKLRALQGELWAAEKRLQNISKMWKKQKAEITAIHKAIQDVTSDQLILFPETGE